MAAAALALALAALGACAAARDVPPSVECVCRSKHAPPALLSLQCTRNSTGRWAAQVGGTVSRALASVLFESAFASCKGVPSRPAPDHHGYELAAGVGYYKLHTAPRAWEEASRTCRAEGAQLAVVGSDAEAATLVATFARHPNISTDHWTNWQAWTGVSDAAEEGTFLTVLGTKLADVGWSKWWTGQPSNRYEDEDCVSMVREGTLNDHSCSMSLPFFCERPL